MDSIRYQFNTLCYALSHEDIVRLSNVSSDVNLHNVVVGLERECFGFGLLDKSEKFEYQIFYANGTAQLRGFLLYMTLDNPDRENLVFMFSDYLTQEFPHLDSIDVFNTFQKHTRFALEKENYFTMTSGEIDKFHGHKTEILIKGRGFEIVTLIDKVEALQAYFGNRHAVELKENENYLYLMLNKRNGLLKIGTSIRPKFRERTLQSQEPEIFLLAIWAAPKKIERELHKLFLEKRQRGEWFKLTSRDMRLIKAKMGQFS